MLCVIVVETARLGPYADCEDELVQVDWPVVPIRFGNASLRYLELMQWWTPPPMKTFYFVYDKCQIQTLNFDILSKKKFPWSNIS